MNFGYVIRKYEFDFGGSESNKGKFTLAVTQDEAPDTIGTEIKFEAEFESKVPISIACDDGPDTIGTEIKFGAQFESKMPVGIACDEGAMAVAGDLSWCHFCSLAIFLPPRDTLLNFKRKVMFSSDYTI